MSQGPFARGDARGAGDSSVSAAAVRAVRPRHRPLEGHIPRESAQARVSRRAHRGRRSREALHRRLSSRIRVFEERRQRLDGCNVGDFPHADAREEQHDESFVSRVPSTELSHETRAPNGEGCSSGLMTVDVSLGQSRQVSSRSHSAMPLTSAIDVVLSLFHLNVRDLLGNLSEFDALINLYHRPSLVIVTET